MADSLPPCMAHPPRVLLRFQNSRRSSTTEEQPQDSFEIGSELQEPKDVEVAHENTSVVEHVELVDVPYHIFSQYTKLFLVYIASATASLSGLSSNIYFPALVDIANDLGISHTTVGFSITTYLLAQGLAPSFWGPLADLYGRRSILIATLTLYLASNVALGLVQNAPMLLVFRAFQGAGSSSTIALGAGIIADLASPKERGGYLGLFSGVRQTSIAIGPVIGGLLEGHLGFRFIFWFLVILTSCILVFVILALPETLRRISGNGCNVSRSIRYAPSLGKLLPYGRKTTLLEPFTPDEQSKLEDECAAEIRDRQPFNFKIFLQPFKIIMEKDVACILTFGACSYTAWSMMTSQTTSYLKDIYGFTTMQVGLGFMANGLGCVTGSILTGRDLDKSFKRESSLWRHSKGLSEDVPIPRPLPITFPIEKARLSNALMYSTIQVGALLIFGWSLTPRTGGIPITCTSHWIAPLLIQFAVGFSNTAIMNSNNTLMVDLFPNRSASASAAVNLTRNLAAAVGVAVAGYITNEMSAGWYGMVLAAVSLAGLLPFYVHGLYGPRWREERQSRLDA